MIEVIIRINLLLPIARRDDYMSKQLMISEHDIQVTLIEWANLMVITGQYPELEYLYAAVNGAKLPYMKTKKGTRFSPEAARLADEGLKAGVPDLCLPVPRGKFHGLYLEMKREDGQIRPDQSRWIAFLHRQGYFIDVAYDFEQAKNFLVSYLDMPAPRNGNRHE